MIIKSNANDKVGKITAGTNAAKYVYSRTQTSGTTATDGSILIESSPAQNSTNLITSGGVYDASLKVTSNKFTRTSSQTVPSGFSEILWQAQENGSNPFIYLSSGKIYIHSSVKSFSVLFSVYTSNSNYSEFFVEYPSPTSFGSGAYELGGHQTTNITIPLVGTGSTQQLVTKINVTNGADILSSILTYVQITALYV